MNVPELILVGIVRTRRAWCQIIFFREKVSCRKVFILNGKMPDVAVRLVRTRAQSRPGSFRMASCLVPILCAAFAGRLIAQQAPAPQTEGIIRGIVEDQSGAAIGGAVVTLETEAKEQRTAITDATGKFQFSQAPAGTDKITITASGFEAWTKEYVTLGFGQNQSVISAVLQVAPASTHVDVGLPPRELAAQQIKEEEKQRVVGVFPNFFVTYEPNPAPLSAKQKFQLGWKTFFDPVPILSSAVGAGLQQARGGYWEYGQGVEGFAKRFGANYADRVDGVLIGHVVTQSIFHQDPRYFYKGTGNFGSRALYAIGTAFVAKGDNGHWQPAYADVLGGMASYELSTLYRPGTSRPWLRLEHTVLLGFAGRAAANLVQEFLLSKVTTHVRRPGTLLSQPVLRVGTPVTLISVKDLNGTASESKEPIEFTLASDLQVGGVVVAKAGAQAWGRVNSIAGPGGNGLNVELERVRLTLGKVEVPLRSTQARGAGTLTYHRLENSARIVIVLYVDNDVTLAPAQ
jgi:hypothetical protein